jgi:hypothetical protein
MTYHFVPSASGPEEGASKVAPLSRTENIHAGSLDFLKEENIFKKKKKKKNEDNPIRVL